jgi:hypothetical protein
MDRAVSLFEGETHLRALDADWGINRFEELRAGGARYAVFTSELFRWLAERPPLEQHLRQTGEVLLANERVRVFSLGPA